MAIFNSKQLNYQRVNISSETHMVTLQVSSETTAAHGAMQSLIVVKASSLSSSLTCRTLPENSLCQNWLQQMSLRWPTIWSNDIPWYQMTLHVLHQKSTTYEVSATSFHIYVHDIPAEKNNLKLAVFMCSRTMLTTYYTQLRSFYKGFLLLLRM